MNREPWQVGSDPAFGRRLASAPRSLYIQLYRQMVRYRWDPGKSAANLAARGFDFAFATLIFDGPTLEQEDRRKDYGERRIVAVGIAQRVQLTVVFTDRIIERADVERRIISARRSNGHERKAYQAALGQD